MEPFENIQPEVHTAPLNVLVLRRDQVKAAKKALERKAADLAEQSMAANDEARELNAILMDLTKAIDALATKDKEK